MYNGKAAENELKTLAELSGGSYLEHDLIRHNLVVFRGGDGALQVRKTKCAISSSATAQSQQLSCKGILRCPKLSQTGLWHAVNRESKLKCIACAIVRSLLLF